MKKKLLFPTELCYLLGMILLALGAQLHVLADFGVSPIVAIPYLLSVKLEPICGFFTFGMTQYVFQTFLLIIMIVLLRRFRLSYLFSFLSAFLFGLIVDGVGLLLGLLPAPNLAVRIVYFILGIFSSAAGVAITFKTYITPEVFELFVMELAPNFKIDIHKFKIGYDWTNCLIALILSFTFFGMWHFVGVSWGTVVTSLVNGWIIARCSKLFEKCFRFEDLFPLRKFFENI